MQQQPQPTERPILFSTAMVQAILAGRKTETRRVVKGITFKENKHSPNHVDFAYKGGFGNHIPKDELGKPFAGITFLCPYGQPGDVLWVREKFSPPTTTQKNDAYMYAADYPVQPRISIWKPSIHMPKAAARIWLQVTEIKVERLQDITDEGAILEGCLVEQEIFVQGELRGAFINVWSSINGYISWALNPWVWVVKFKVLSTTGKPQNL